MLEYTPNRNKGRVKKALKKDKKGDSNQVKTIPFLWRAKKKQHHHTTPLPRPQNTKQTNKKTPVNFSSTQWINQLSTLSVGKSMTDVKVFQ